MRWTRTDKAILENIILFTQSSRSNWTESVEDDSELEDDSSTSWWKIISAKIAKLCTLPIMCITDMSGFVFEPEIRKDSSWFWHIPTRIEGSYAKRGGPTRRRLQVSVVVIKKYWKATWSGGRGIQIKEWVPGINQNQGVGPEQPQVSTRYRMGKNAQNSSVLLSEENQMSWCD